MKTCYRCRQEKSESEFGFCARFRDGLRKECKVCGRADALSYRNKNLDRQRQNKRDWAASNPDLVLAYAREYYAENRAAILPKARVRVKEYRRTNPDKVRASAAKFREKNREELLRRKRAANQINPEPNRRRAQAWAKANPARMNARSAARKATQLQATPGWVNEFFVQEAYLLAKRRSEITGFEWQVDHIVPLISKVVCGLHVENNMQVIPAIDNFRKNNRFWPDMP